MRYSVQWMHNSLAKARRGFIFTQTQKWTPWPFAFTWTLTKCADILQIIVQAARIALSVLLLVSGFRTDGSVL